MRTLLISLLLAISLPVGLRAQEVFTYSRSDSISYALYQQGAWKELIQFGNASVAVGQDFPLLRQRLGYAVITEQGYLRGGLKRRMLRLLWWPHSPPAVSLNQPAGATRHQLKAPWGGLYARS